MRSLLAAGESDGEEEISIMGVCRVCIRRAVATEEADEAVA